MPISRHAQLLKRPKLSISRVALAKDATCVCRGQFGAPNVRTCRADLFLGLARSSCAWAVLTRYLCAARAAPANSQYCCVPCAKSSAEPLSPPDGLRLELRLWGEEGRAVHA